MCPSLFCRMWYLYSTVQCNLDYRIRMIRPPVLYGVLCADYGGTYCTVERGSNAPTCEAAVSPYLFLKEAKVIQASLIFADKHAFSFSGAILSNFLIRSPSMPALQARPGPQDHRRLFWRPQLLTSQGMVPGPKKSQASSARALDFSRFPWTRRRILSGARVDQCPSRRFPQRLHQCFPRDPCVEMTCPINEYPSPATSSSGIARWGDAKTAPDFHLSVSRNASNKVFFLSSSHELCA
ncbi:hypothetical protein BJ875DRAFT_74639 [Amylocarpus encephaloides]|uniref:Uncharacterized protein n=1 Tax=Amylocarpus encephaloides TaxID=45428 RepID=A0A9P7YFK2_9HELO|nr:hypothetical protein BJ875DRAFT_74639 [Amylocarpus encephaloides]